MLRTSLLGVALVAVTMSPGPVVAQGEKPGASTRIGIKDSLGSREIRPSPRRLPLHLQIQC